MAFTLNRRLAQLVDSNGQLNTGKIPNDYITGDHIADNVITSAMLHTSFTVSTSNLTAIDTDDVSEGASNLYFTNARADARIAAATTDDLTEGSTNLYYTTARWDTKMAAANTDDLSEGLTNLYFTNARVDSHLSGGTGVTYSSGAISIGQDVSTTATPTFGNITTTGYIAGPATFTIDPAAVGDNTGTVVIAGNLQVDGTTTTINSTTVNIDDLNIQLATGAANAAAADGAGITVDGASATITYDGTNNRWDFNKSIEIGSGYGGTPNTDSQLIINDSGNNYITIGSGATSEGGILFADSADNDVGVISYNHSTNNLAFRTNGVSNRMIIDSSGDVGIGTTNPSARLHIQPANSDTLANAIFTRQNNAAGSDGNSFALRNDAANNFVEMNSGGTNNGGFKFYRGSFSDDPALTIIGSGVTGGNVGIGTSSPATTLDVAGTITGDALTINTSPSQYLQWNDTASTVLSYYVGSASIAASTTTDIVTFNGGANHYAAYDLTIYSTDTSYPAGIELTRMTVLVQTTSSQVSRSAMTIVDQTSAYASGTGNLAFSIAASGTDLILTVTESDGDARGLRVFVNSEFWSANRYGGATII